MPRRTRRLVFLIAAAFAAGCDRMQEPRVATKLVVTPAAATLSETGSQQFTAKILDQNNQALSGAVVIWQSDDPKLVTVDSTGLATATASFLDVPDPLAAVSVTATAGSLSGKASIGLSRAGTFDAWPDTNMVYPGMTRAITTRLIRQWGRPGGGSPPNFDVIPAADVQWSTSDATVVTVDAAGVMTSMAPGHTRIIAKYTTHRDTVEAFVTAPPATPLRFTSLTSDAVLLNTPARFATMRACGLATNGSIYCWGATLDSTQISDRCEQSGPGGVQGTRIVRFRCSEIPLRLQTDLKFTGLATASGGLTAFGVSGCGLATTKRVYCWGANPNGELGIGTTDNTTHGLAPIAGTDEFTELHGSGPFCGIRTDGALRCWGGGYGPSPVTVNSSKPWRTLTEAGGCGLANDSTAYCFGTAAQSVGGTTRWKFIATVPFGSPCALAPDDSVYCGSNLQDKQTIPEAIVRLGYYATGFIADIGLTNRLCALTAGGDLRCTSDWALVSLPMKLRSFYGRCVIAVDDKVYCRLSNSATFVVIPGQQ